MKTWIIIIILTSLINAPWCWSQTSDVLTTDDEIRYSYDRLKNVAEKIQRRQDDIKTSGWMVWLVEENADRAGYWYGATRYPWSGHHFMGPYWSQRAADEFTLTVTEMLTIVKRYNQFVRFYNQSRRELIDQLITTFPDSCNLPTWAKQPLPDEFPIIDLSPPKSYFKEGSGK